VTVHEENREKKEGTCQLSKEIPEIHVEKAIGSERKTKSRREMKRKGKMYRKG
jgi:hypothetical protein